MVYCIDIKPLTVKDAEICMLC